MLKFLPPPPEGTLRIVEPFLGSGSYSLHWSSRRRDIAEVIGIDSDERLIKLWDFLKKVTPEEMRSFNFWWEGVRKGNKPAPKFEEVREKFGEGFALYFRINVCGIYTGQWSSYQSYTRHSLPVEETLKSSLYLDRFQVSFGDWKSVRGLLRGGDFVFLDPPYLGTFANYKDGSSFDPKDLVSEIIAWKVPTLITYGKGAKEIFPGLDWDFLTMRKVPRIRGGGFLLREEWSAKINWPEVNDSLSMFKVS